MHPVRTLIALLLPLLFCATPAAAQPRQAGAPDPDTEAASSPPKWVATDGPIGGLGYDIRYNFNNPKIWYVTDSYAGLNMSSDDGKTWSRSIQGLTTRRGAGDSIPVFCVTVDPNDANIVWAGTQESGDIYKSTDAGRTWMKKINGIDRSKAMWLSFRGLTPEPGNSLVVYAMGEIASPGFTPDGASRICFGPDSTKGVVYKTTDGGENWTLIWSGNNLTRYCFIDPRNHDVLYVSTGIFDREASDCDAASLSPGGVGILKSTDGGKSWRVLNRNNGLADLHVGSLYMNPQYPDVLLAAASNPDWSTKGGTNTAGVFLSENGGESWTRVLSNEMYAAVEFCTSNPDVAYAASPLAVYRSGDRGKTWQRFDRGNGTWGPEGVIAGVPIDMQCDPNDSERIFVNNYLGGNFLSTDGGKTWTIASQGYTGAQMGFVVVSPSDSRLVFGGSRTGVFRNDNAGMGEWTGLSQVIKLDQGGTVNLNEVNGLAVDPSNDDHLIAAPLDLGGIVGSHDGGKTWTLSSMVRLPGGLVGRLAFSPTTPSRAYCTVKSSKCKIDQTLCDDENAGLWISNDGGQTWSAVTAAEVHGHSVLEVAPHPTNSSIVYISMPGRGVWRTSDGGSTWTNNSSGLPANASVVTLAIDPSRPDTLFAGLTRGGAYRTMDAGQTWSNVSSGMDPESSITDIVVDPTSGVVVYAGEADMGVYRSVDGGTSWSLYNDGLINRAIPALAISKDGARLYAATNGAGVSRIDLKPATGKRRAVGRR